MESLPSDGESEHTEQTETEYTEHSETEHTDRALCNEKRQHANTNNHASNGSNDDINDGNESNNGKGKWGRCGTREDVLWDACGAPIWPVEKGGEFSRFLGSLATDAKLFPIDVASWNSFKKSDNLDRLWERVKRTIDWSNPETLAKQYVIRNYVLKIVNDRWRQHKHQLKEKYWKPHQNSPSRFLCPDNNMDSGLWVRFVTRLDNEEMKEKAAINVANRKRKKMSHTTGTLTFAAKIHKWRMENKIDAQLDRKERFKITHLKKGSTTQYIDEASAQAMSIFEQKEAEKKKQNIEITPEVVEDIYADVFGAEKRNRVRGMGTGYTWEDVSLIHIEKREKMGASKEVETLKAAVEEQKNLSARAMMEVERLRNEASRERNEVAEREKKHQAELHKIRCDQHQMMENMRKMQVFFSQHVADIMTATTGNKLLALPAPSLALEENSNLALPQEQGRLHISPQKEKKVGRPKGTKNKAKHLGATLEKKVPNNNRPPKRRP